MVDIDNAQTWPLINDDPEIATLFVLARLVTTMESGIELSPAEIRRCASWFQSAAEQIAQLQKPASWMPQPPKDRP